MEAERTRTRKEVLCPLHGHLTVLRHLHTSEHKVFGDYIDEKIKVQKIVYYNIEECTICNGPFIFSTENHQSISDTDEELLWPEMGILPKSVPSSVRKYYRKAKMKMANDAEGCAHDIRLGLEAICNDRRAGTSNESLADRIDALARKDGFPKLIKEMMQVLRHIGNFGSHVRVRARIKPKHVPAIDMFFRAVVQYVYIAPVLLKDFNQYVRRPKNPPLPKADRVPLFNPKVEFEGYRNEILQDVATVAENGTYVNGKQGDNFEKQLANDCQVRFAIGTSSGTMALELMLRADGVGQGQRVVTSAHTFVAVVEAILAVGAEPSFVDIDPDTWQMPAGNWPGDVVMACHLYGGVSPAVNSTARLLYEDASQSFGGALGGRALGTLARAGAISLYPTKNLSAMGDAGVILTSDKRLANRLRALRNHGQTAPQVHDYCGTTGRMDEIQAAILCEKLKHFAEFLNARREAARYYLDHLRDLPLKFPMALPESDPAPNLFVVRTEARDELKAFLGSRNISTGIHYPTPLHLLPAYRKKAWAKVSLPHTERLCAEILSLPLWVGISPEQQARVVAAIREFFGANGRAV